MQVKKFEAKSMKEAIQMVKVHLGPDAVILSARDNSKGFGLLGEKSVEVTAAISETTLRKKQIAEQRLNSQMKSKFEQSSARNQKIFIDKYFDKKEEPAAAPLRGPATSMRYIDIQDDAEVAAAAGAPVSAQAAEARIRGAAARALEEFHSVADEPPPVVKPRPVRRPTEESSEVLALRKEILQLRHLISSFQQVPQNFVSMHPGAEAGLSYEVSESYQKLCRAGITAENAVEILKQAQSALPHEQAKKPALVDAWVAKFLLDKIHIAEHRTRNRYHVFVGPAGQGKTASLLKLASHLVICEKKKIAIITTDSVKLGAAEQLKIYAQILNVPFAIVRRREDWELLESRLKNVDHILVDSPGLSLRSIQEVDWMRDTLPPTLGGRSVHYVQSVMAKDEEATEVGQRYKAVGFDDVIFTNLDQAAQHGLIYNFQKIFEVPLHSFGIGSQIPEDFEPATKERVVDLIFKLTKIKRKEA
jgi:flagellar biosynthesis protein FlhF